MATKQNDNAININTIENEIDNCVIEFFNQYNIDIYDLSQCKQVTHNLLNLCFKYIYKRLFKPDHSLICNKKSLVDYNDITQLTIIANKFVEICQHFNKSLGLMSFAFMLGCDYSTLYLWLQSDETLNPARFKVLKSIQECHKLAQINLLNDTPVGALAVANNDVETGLEWSKQQAAQIAQNTVYILPSERLNRLKLDKQAGDTEV